MTMHPQGAQRAAGRRLPLILAGAVLAVASAACSPSATEVEPTTTSAPTTVSTTEAPVESTLAPETTPADTGDSTFEPGSAIPLDGLPTQVGEFTLVESYGEPAYEPGDIDRTVVVGSYEMGYDEAMVSMQFDDGGQDIGNGRGLCGNTGSTAQCVFMTEAYGPVMIMSIVDDAATSLADVRLISEAIIDALP